MNLSGRLHHTRWTVSKVPDCKLAMPSPPEIPEAPPWEAGLDGERLSELSGWLDELPGLNIHAVVVVRQGLLVFELHRSGPDQRWRKALAEARHTANTLHDIRSVTKSIVGLLIGIAIERGILPRRRFR